MVTCVWLIQSFQILYAREVGQLVQKYVWFLMKSIKLGKECGELIQQYGELVMVQWVHYYLSFMRVRILCLERCIIELST